MSDARNQNTAPCLQVHIKLEQEEDIKLEDICQQPHCNNSIKRESFKCGVCGEYYFCEKDFCQHVQSHHSKPTKVEAEAGTNTAVGISNEVVQETIGTAHGSTFGSETGIGTGELPYSCSQCDYKCNQKSQLKIHSLKHSGEKPFQCDTCTYATTNKSNLSRHILLHTGELPYSCSQCDYKCNQKIRMKVHAMKHTGEKPFHCDTCSFATADKGNLAKHIRIHAGELPYSCSQCDYKCNRKHQLKIHTKKHNLNIE